MKNFAIMLLLISFSALQAQKISEYQYIVVPKKFTDFKENQYRLNTYLKTLLQKKNYEILSDDAQQWPVEARENPCLVSFAEVRKVQNFLNNQILLLFKDCEQNIIGSWEGLSNLKEFDRGYQEALKKATEFIQISNPIPIAPKAPEHSQIPEIQSKIDLQEIKVPHKTGIEFKNEHQSVLLTELENGGFSLIQKENSEIIATLKPSSKSGVYHVQIQNATDTYHSIGFYDGETLGIEFTADGKRHQLIEYKKQN